MNMKQKRVDILPKLIEATREGVCQDFRYVLKF